MKYIKSRKTIYEDLNLKVWEWFCDARSRNVPLSGKMIQVRPFIFLLMRA